MMTHAQARRRRQRQRPIWDGVATPKPETARPALRPSDATPSYRGYRLQAIYSLYRILEPAPSERGVPSFQPEGREDLAVFAQDGVLTEACQVKALGTPLVLSDFKIDKPDSFFYRAAELLDSEAGAEIRIASFGPIGPELERSAEGDQGARDVLTNKLVAAGHMTRQRVQRVLSSLIIERVDEQVLRACVDAHLRQSLAGVDPATAFDLLLYWLYDCAEHRRLITRRELVAKVDAVGQFLADRVQYHTEWYTAILPFGDSELGADDCARLREEFYQGVQARYEHVLADLDVPRPEQIQAVRRGLEVHRVVVVHAASGQGKTTLAYRYFRDHVPEAWRLRVTLVEGRQHATRVARALLGHASALNIPITLYLDVSPRDTAWPELVRELLVEPAIRVLITIREEDWRRASMPEAAFRPFEVDLAFHEGEARRIYDALISVRRPDHVVDFGDAWGQFGGEGPLLEFVHLVTHDASLRDRLAAQVNRLRDEVRAGVLPGGDLDLLRTVAVASEYEARLDVGRLASDLGLAEPARSLELLEREYLVRLSEDGALVAGLHPIRSRVLCEMLLNPVLAPWGAAAARAVRALHEPDLEVFLLHALSRHRGDAEKIEASLHDLQPRSWSGLAGVARALIWYGVACYADTHEEVIRAVRERSGSGWIVLLRSDLAGVMPEANPDANIGLLPPDGQAFARSARARFADHDRAFRPLEAWLERRERSPEPPASAVDWSAMAEVLFWAGRRGQAERFLSWVDLRALDREMATLPLEVLADVSLALAELGAGADWRERYRGILQDRFRQDTNTPVLRDDGTRLTAKFLISVDAADGVTDTQALAPPAVTERPQLRSDDERSSLHEETIQRLGLMRRLFPEVESFGSQGYGHRLWPEVENLDSMLKTGVDRSYLPPIWLTKVNATYTGYAERRFRPDTWREYAEGAVEQREAILALLVRLERGLARYFGSARTNRLLGTEIDGGQWDACRRLLRQGDLLPACATDEWGFGVEERNAHSGEQRTQSLVLARASLALARYRSPLKSRGALLRAMQNFLDQAPHALSLLPLLWRNARDEPERQRVIEVTTAQGIKPEMVWLSGVNLTDAVKALPRFQHACRQLVGDVLAPEVWAELDRREERTYARVLSLWHFFIRHPGRHLTDACEVRVREDRRFLRRIRERLVKALEVLTERGIRSRILADGPLWDDAPALYIELDSHDALLLQTSVEEIVELLRGPLRERLEHTSRHLLDASWSSVVLVPIVYGKSLGATCWAFPQSVLASDGDVHPAFFVPKPLGTSLKEEIGVQVWSGSAFSLGQQLCGAVADSWTAAAHLREVSLLEQTDSLAASILDRHIERVAEMFANSAETARGVMAQMARLSETVSGDDLARRPFLAGALRGVADLARELEAMCAGAASQPCGEQSWAELAAGLALCRDMAAAIYWTLASDTAGEVRRSQDRKWGWAICPG